MSFVVPFVLIFILSAFYTIALWYCLKFLLDLSAKKFQDKDDDE